MKRNLIAGSFVLLLSSSPAYAYIVIAEAGRQGSTLSQAETLIRQLFEQLITILT